jgi:large subunit ribosomal protein L32
MGALPKRKISTRRKGKRRAARKLKVPSLVICPQCGGQKPPHQVCPACGYYKGQAIFKPTVKKGKKKAKSG